MPAKPAIFGMQPFETADYDPGPARERIRGTVAVAASVTFLVTVGFFLAESALANDGAWKHVTEAMHVVLPAVASVLGTVLGFYFGSQKR